MMRSGVEFGFSKVGEDVWVSDKASIYSASKISIGDHVRIDDFCILSAGEGGIALGNFIHIACYSSLIGHALIQLHDYANIAARTSILSSSDDFSGRHLIGPTVEEKYRKVTHREVTIGAYSVIGAGCVVLPGSHIGANVAVGAMSLVRGYLENDSIYVGVPIKRIKGRERRCL